MVQRDVPSRLTIHSCLAIQRSDEAVNTPSFRGLKGNSTDGGTDEPTPGLTVALLQNCASRASASRASIVRHAPERNYAAH